jgi:hypothetical protein
VAPGLAYRLGLQQLENVSKPLSRREPTLRIVYDQSVPGAYQAAMATVSEFRAKFPNLQQPGVTTGLREVG